MRAILALTLAAFVMTPAPSAAQSDPRAAEAEAVVRALFDDLAAMRWEAAAGWFHPDALAQIHDHWTVQARAQESARAGPRAYPPDMPETVRAWFEEQRERTLAALDGTPEFSFPGRRSAAELEGMTAATAMARFLESRDLRSIPLARIGEIEGLSAEQVHELTNVVTDRREVVGTVVEGDSLVHVVYRAGLAGADGGPYDPETAVATLRHEPDGWRVWTVDPDDRIFGLENVGWAFNVVPAAGGEPMDENGTEGT